MNSKIHGLLAPAVRSEQLSKWRGDALLLLLLYAAGAALAWQFISHERFFYFWDYGGFQGVAINQAFDFLRNPAEVIFRIRSSLATEYNYLYTIPLIPLIWIFGATRLSYVLAVTLVYQLPLALALGGIATQLIPGKARPVFWSTAFLTLATPIAWVPTLRGYPDAGGALLVALAVLVYLRDPRLFRTRTLVLPGILLALAMLFRRHFAYSAAAFLGAVLAVALVSSLAKARTQRLPVLHALLRGGLRAGGLAAAMFVTLALIGRSFLYRLVKVDYLALYASYELSPVETLQAFWLHYGWATCILALAGLALGMARKRLAQPAAWFLALNGAFFAALWAGLARQTSIQYTLHTTPLVVLGLSALLWAAVSLPQKGRRLAWAGALCAFIAANLAYGLAPLPIPAATRSILSAYNGPLYRGDYDEVAKLVAYLRAIVPSREPIYVVDSSNVMNYDLIRMGEAQLYPNDQQLEIMVTPQVDSRDAYPLEQLLRARWVVVTTPLQYHLTPAEQQVVVSVYEMFHRGGGLAGDFERLPQAFQLVGGSTLNIYRRVRSTPAETALLALDQVRDAVGQRPAGQPDWIIASNFEAVEVTQKPGSSSQIKINWGPGSPASAAQLIFAGPPGEQGSIIGSLSFDGAGCAGISLALQALDAGGKLIELDSQQIPPGAGELPFSLDDRMDHASSVLLSIGQAQAETPAGSCQVRIDGLRVAARGS